jgi:hypothetical protein
MVQVSNLFMHSSDFYHFQIYKIIHISINYTWFLFNETVVRVWQRGNSTSSPKKSNLFLDTNYLKMWRVDHLSYCNQGSTFLVKNMIPIHVTLISCYNLNPSTLFDQYLIFQGLSIEVVFLNFVQNISA